MAPSDDYHNPPPTDTRSRLGGDTFVSHISARIGSATVGPPLSPKVELKSDERNLISYEDNDEDDIDIDDNNDKVMMRRVVTNHNQWESSCY